MVDNLDACEIVHTSGVKMTSTLFGVKLLIVFVCFLNVSLVFTIILPYFVVYPRYEACLLKRLRYQQRKILCYEKFGAVLCLQSVNIHVDLLV